MQALDPDRLVSEASINRVRLGGRTARELLSAPGLVALARSAGLDPVGPPRSWLDARMADPRVRAVTDEYGRRLGTLFDTLRRGDRDARPEWDHPSWWQRWAGASTIWLGGGLAGGAFGARVAEVAGARVAEHPEDLPLRGAARVGDPRVVLDFGHTWVKRATVRDGVLSLLPPVPAPPGDADGPAVAASVLATLRAVADGPVTAAMAAYLVDGRPERTVLGTYTRLADVTGDVRGWLAARLGQELVLLHDGTAAARAVPPDPHAVVVLLGTSLGVGYPA